MKIIFAVFDYLHTDYRVFKTTRTYYNNSYDVKLYGITDKVDDVLLGWDNVGNIERLSIVNNFPLKVNMFIFWYKLFFKLLFSDKKISKDDTILYCHDIFPLLPIYLISKIKKVPFIYDSHEFTYGNHHYENKPFTKFFWRSYEKFLIKGASKVITVSQSIADDMEKIYKFKKGSIEVISNLPLKRDSLKSNISESIDLKYLHKELKIDPLKKIILYQGRLLFNNGLEKVIEAFDEIKEDSDFVFVLIGDGIKKKELMKMVNDLKIGDRVFFKELVPQSELYKYTRCAYLGICLIKNSGKSFYYSTPNKMYEYLQAGVPQLSSNFPEISKVVKDNEIGITIDPDNVEQISEKINNLTDEQHKMMVGNCFKIRDKYYWDNIEEKLVEIVKDLA